MSDDLAHWLKVSAIGLGAGAIGQYTIFPLDTVKTLLQGGPGSYTGAWDCAQQVVRRGGVLSLWRGVVGVALLTSPEKSLKLGVNDYARWRLKSDEGHGVSVAAEVAAGAVAGAAQNVITTPMEILKIRMQASVAGEGGARARPLQMMRDIGLRNMYRGARATWLRDVPFSMLYFPLFHVLKQRVYERSDKEKLGPHEIFGVALVAGSVAATAVTPADVIKTRVQLSTGRTPSIAKVSRELWAEGGVRSFFKGLSMRLLTRGPQFSVTLMSYELLQRWFGDGESTSDFSLQRD